jgi:hypothetical protein
MRVVVIDAEELMPRRLFAFAALLLASLAA